MPPVWEIVGGGSKGGILVREGFEISSPKAPSRLSTGATVQELSHLAERLHYRRLTGTGPDEGWISVSLDNKTLAEPLGDVPLPPGAAAGAAGCASGGEPRETARPVAEKPDMSSLDSLEIAYALAQWLSDPVAAVQACASIGVTTLRKLMCEVCKRLGTSVRHKFCVDFPHGKDDLHVLAERIADLEELKELVGLHWPEPEEQARARRELLGGGIGSVSGLAGATHPRPSALYSGNPEFLEEARRIGAEGPSGRTARSCRMVRFGDSPFLATAPHNIYLIRDGHPYHAMEGHTTVIAQHLVRDLDGGAICWTSAAQWRSEICYALGSRQRGAGVATAVERALDASNQDPNYLEADKLGDNVWYHHMESWAARHGGGGGGPALHVDIHGCQDPPHHSTYVILGFGAMRQHAEGLPLENGAQEAGFRHIQQFAQAIKKSAGEMLAGFFGRPPEEMVALRGLTSDTDAKKAEDLTGARPLELNRFTQTQQSILRAGVTHAVQIEMGMSLRRKLAKNPEAISELGHAIYSAWRGVI